MRNHDFAVVMGNAEIPTRKETPGALVLQDMPARLEATDISKTRT
jgi:hypothetical protein